MSNGYASDLLQDDKKVRIAEIAKMLNFKPFNVQQMEKELLQQRMHELGYGVDPITFEYWPLEASEKDESPTEEKEVSNDEVERLRQRNKELEEQVRMLAMQLEMAKQDTGTKEKPDNLKVPEFSDTLLHDLMETKAPLRSNANHHFSHLANILMEEFNSDFRRIARFGTLSQKYLWNAGVVLLCLIYFDNRSEPWLKELAASHVSPSNFTLQLILHFCAVAGIEDLSFLEEIIESSPTVKY